MSYQHVLSCTACLTLPRVLQVLLHFIPCSIICSYYTGNEWPCLSSMCMVVTAIQKFAIHQQPSLADIVIAVWDSSIVMAKYFERWGKRWQGKRCLDLSAGCGLVGTPAATSPPFLVTASSALLENTATSLTFCPQNHCHCFSPWLHHHFFRSQHHHHSLMSDSPHIALRSALVPSGRQCTYRGYMQYCLLDPCPYCSLAIGPPVAV